MSDRDDFARAAHECLAYEDNCYDFGVFNWSDLRDAADKTAWPSQWCHGAVGIGLARIARRRAGKDEAEIFVSDILMQYRTRPRTGPSMLIRCVAAHSVRLSF